MIHVDINNVARWVLSIPPKDFDYEKNCPCLAPPFDEANFYYWTEAFNFRVHVVGQEVDDVARQLAGFSDDVKWLVVFTCYSTKPSNLRDELALGALTYNLDGFGEELPQHILAVPHKHNGDPTYRNAIIAVVTPVLVAISLMHCRNVEMIDMPVTRQMRRQAERKGRPLIQYKTLILEPFRKQVRKEAAERGQSEMHRALHICRGHFATYSDDKPLFGKYTGTFWRPMHVRGSKQYGQVVKDYKIDTSD